MTVKNKEHNKHTHKTRKKAKNNNNNNINTTSMAQLALGRTARQMDGWAENNKLTNELRDRCVGGGTWLRRASLEEQPPVKDMQVMAV